MTANLALFFFIIALLITTAYLIATAPPSGED